MTARFDENEGKLMGAIIKPGFTTGFFIAYHDNL